MADRPGPTELEIKTNELIKRGKAAWYNRRGDVFCYTRTDPLPGQTEAREHPPLGLAFGVIVHPDDFGDLTDRIARGDIRY